MLALSFLPFLTCTFFHVGSLPWRCEFALFTPTFCTRDLERIWNELPGLNPEVDASRVLTLLLPSQGARTAGTLRARRRERWCAPHATAVMRRQADAELPSIPTFYVSDLSCLALLLCLSSLLAYTGW